MGILTPAHQSPGTETIVPSWHCALNDFDRALWSPFIHTSPLRSSSILFRLPTSLMTHSMSLEASLTEEMY